MLFSDLVGSTELGERLDSEVVRDVLAAYFATMARVIEVHGGTVEKYIGDAIMAVFGIPMLHEDDALRAVRAASDMQRALAEFNRDVAAERGVTLQARIGVATGEVAAGDPSHDATLVTGDAVNTAARLQQVAEVGEILVAASTRTLLGDAARVEPVSAIHAKGKAAAVVAFRLIAVDSAIRPLRTRTVVERPLVGRAAELAFLRTLFSSTVGRYEPRAVCVVGAAGIGKSRLVREFLSLIDDRTTVLRGRCLPYGEGITWWPVREIMHEAAGITDDDDARSARARLERLVSGIRDGRILAARLASAVGLSEEPAPLEEIFWAIRRVLESLAAKQPLVVVVEDIHWAEPTLLRALDHLVTNAGRVPLLMVYLARPESRELLPDGSADGRTVTWLALGPLDASASDEILDVTSGSADMDAHLRARILATAEGNPLFLEALVGARSEMDLDPAGQERMPATIGALLAARIDALPPMERDTVRRASVVGREFPSAAVRALAGGPKEDAVDASLTALVGKEIIGSLDDSPAQHGGGVDQVTASYRFRHILLRNAAYEGLTKRSRADLHDRFATWLEDHAGDRLAEYEEILGHHLEQAHHYRAAIRDAPARTRFTGERATAYLRSSALRARQRGDLSAAAGLVLRATRLPAPDARSRAELLVDAARITSDVGRLAEAKDFADQAMAIASKLGDQRLSVYARFVWLEVAKTDGSIVFSDPAAVAARAAIIRDAAASGDPLAQMLAWRTRYQASYLEGRLDRAMSQLRRALGYARRTTTMWPRLELEIDVVVLALSGPTPASAVLSLAAPVLADAERLPTVGAGVLRLTAIARAMLRQPERAEAEATEAIRVFQECAASDAVAQALENRAWVRRLGGDLAGAEADLRAALAAVESLGDREFATVLSCRLAQVLVSLGRSEEAEPYLLTAEGSHAFSTRTRVIGLRARMKARAGDRGAIDDVRRLLDLVRHTQLMNARIDALVDAAEALGALGESSAVGYLGEALRRAEAKENEALAAQLRPRLAGLQPHPRPQRLAAAPQPG